LKDHARVHLGKERGIVDRHHLDVERAVGTPTFLFWTADDNQAVRLECYFGSGPHGLSLLVPGFDVIEHLLAELIADDRLPALAGRFQDLEQNSKQHSRLKQRGRWRKLPPSTTACRFSGRREPISL
jgi:hypothetical protein